jgi:N-acetylglucosamine-6-phosphate deacetylase
MLIRNARLILPERILPAADLRVRDGLISRIGACLAVETGEAVLDASGRFLAPGFVDLHIHGALGRDTMEATAEAFSQICRFHATGGTTALALTTISAPQDAILAVLRAAGTLDPNATGGARILGIHIEGPYFSPQKPGAHLPEMIRNPDPREYREWLRYRDRITQITLAPELPGALECIEEMVAAGIRVSGGHSDAWDEEAAAGHAHGMRQVTHTYNCMSGARRRGAYRVAGLLEYALSEPEILCELIADGHHVSPTLMRALYRAKGPDGIAVVTDAGGGAGMPVGTTFQLGAVEAVVHPGISLTADGLALACSVARMNEMVRVLVERADVPLQEAVRMASTVPAAALGLESTLGSLREGLSADLILLDDCLHVEMTFVAGQRVH